MWALGLPRASSATGQFCILIRSWLFFVIACPIQAYYYKNIEIKNE